MYYIKNYHANIFNLRILHMRTLYFYCLHSCLIFLQPYIPTPSWIHDFFYNQYFLIIILVKVLLLW